MVYDVISTDSSHFIEESDHKNTNISVVSSSHLSYQNVIQRKANLNYRNYIYFCFLYSITHASVDAVVSFATAELG